VHLIVLSIVLLSIIYQDFKERAVYLFWYPLLLLVIVYQYFIMPGYVPYELIAFNLFFVGVLVGFVFLYYRFRKYTMKSFFATVFGFGDLLFFVFMALFFTPANFLVVFNSSLILCLLLATGLKSFKTRGVPLAGVQATVVLFWVVGVQLSILPSNFDDYWLLNL